LISSSCHESEKIITVSEKRERTLFDERFSADIKDRPPLGWRAIPTTQFRLKNYLAGPDEQVQIFFGITQGEVLQNANRWLGQFSISPAADLDAFKNVPMLGAQAYLVEASGKFGGGMGQAPKDDHGLLGLIRPQKGNVLTIKMTGPKSSVEGLREEFLEYARTLEQHAPQMIPDGNTFKVETS